MAKDKACILLGIWGKKYIDDFFRYSLPSLLAPGNIPALATSYETTFLFLSKKTDVALFKRQKAFKTLETRCKVAFLEIDDLIVNGNYSTTLTLAFDRAIKHSHEAMLETYFIFLTADYIMANGSFLGLMRYMGKGYSGICTGNFQVNAHDIEPFLKKQLDAKTGMLSIEPRELLKASFEHLHLMTVASLINHNIIRNYKLNRFFYRHYKELMLGRFYLLHMLCIKPETMDYTIGSSCDYSFIPEMCPSGNIAVINDSDDYLVVEMQPQDHEIQYLSWGKYNMNRLCHSLREWTTKQHRCNIEHTVYFHTDDLRPSDVKVAGEQFQAFLDPIIAKLKKYRAAPHVNHPYWLSAIKAFNYERKKNTAKLLPHKRLASPNLRAIRDCVYGAAPNVFPWHFRWKEYQQMRTIFRDVIKKNPQDVLILHAPQLVEYNDWLRDKCGITHQYSLQYLAQLVSLAGLKKGQLSSCVLIINATYFKKVRALLLKICPFLKNNGELSIIIFNDNNHCSAREFNFPGELIQEMGPITDERYNVQNVISVYSNLTNLGLRMHRAINQSFSHSRILRGLALSITAFFGSIYSLIRNLLSLIFNFQHGHCVAVCLTVIPNKYA
ncbi:MAG: hypothetical protein NXI01_03870 [Gammaproteobacteria bacterium]|nr:hypothetical protein [Gammaproteobacteria bacterium]